LPSPSPRACFDNNSSPSRGGNTRADKNGSACDNLIPRRESEPRFRSAKRTSACAIAINFGESRRRFTVNRRFNARFGCRPSVYRSFSNLLPYPAAIAAWKRVSLEGHRAPMVQRLSRVTSLWEVKRKRRAKFPLERERNVEQGSYSSRCVARSIPLIWTNLPRRIATRVNREKTTERTE